MLSVALPAPSFALTTSSPPYWILCTRAFHGSLPCATSMEPWVCEIRGTIVTPEWPPTTVTGVFAGSVPAIPARKREARTTSRVVIPNSLRGLKVPAFSRTEATMGTVELTGLEMTRMCAAGETREMVAARSRTMLALV